VIRGQVGNPWPSFSYRLKHERYSKHYGTSRIRRSIVRGPHFIGPQFTHWSALAVRKLWSV